MRLRLSVLLLGLAATGCLSARQQSKLAAARMLSCNEGQIELVANDVYRGCGSEVFCSAGMCRSSMSWQQRFGTVSARFAKQFRCEVSATRVVERETDYVVQGCGRQATCPLGQDCVEYMALPVMLERTRSTFSRDTGCAEANITVAYTTDGFRALGCNRAATCVTVDGPCMAISPPPCPAVAAQRYDECLTLARLDGKPGDDCRPRYEASLGECTAGGAAQ